MLKSKTLRVALLLLAAVYVYWLMYREYTLKYTYVGAINTAVWRALNAPEHRLLKDLTTLTNQELGVSAQANPCKEALADIRFPVTCDFFGEDLGGKSRNCRFWWLGRNCRVFYVPETFYARPEIKQRLSHALTRPCSVFFDPATRPTVSISPDDLDAYSQARYGFDCGNGWTILPVEIRLHILGRDGSVTIETIKTL
jgi:hypothetical protein